jgi:hypothetical protein
MSLLRTVFLALVGPVWLSTGAALAADSTPLPANLKFERAADSVPPEVARFTGKWVGKWDGALDSILAVTRVYRANDGTYHADAVYSWGAYSPWRIRTPGYREYEASVTDEELKIQSGPLTITYRIGADGKSLAGKYSRMPGAFAQGAFVKDGE